MEKQKRILIVEDDMIIAANLSLQLSQLNYEITGIESRGEEAVLHAQLNPPDMVLMDINLRGALDGVETARRIHEHQDIPVIYLTANNDEATFNRAKETRPRAFISKPFNKLDLQRTVALVAEEIRTETDGPKPQSGEVAVMNDRVFIRHNGKMIKLLLDQILYIEADRNYCKLATNSGEYLVVCTLKTIEGELDTSKFVRVHRSFMVNLAKLDVVAEGHLEIARKTIPISKSYKEQLMARLHTL
ncbi:LytR/AlgR family response regulator transcription factor [Lentiprolixibacter aurantiacus]|uniref:Response regulator n=1 Tax=Lentiprolixibacter aurantiacus TaxID=2993939 RepID=A0AAE3SP67_9FLAO|nr:response regulator [Lentiprolixibacter aurantiacus]MCX2720285.1 response regulator [Lentiprolixibacter aurantiacus]